MKILKQIFEAIIANRAQQARAYRGGYRYYYY
jgi:hypothetical protein